MCAVPLSNRFFWLFSSTLNKKWDRVLRDVNVLAPFFFFFFPTRRSRSVLSAKFFRVSFRDVLRACARTRHSKTRSHTGVISYGYIYVEAHTHTHSHTHWRKIDNCASCSDCFSYLPAHSSSATFSFTRANFSFFF